MQELHIDLKKVAETQEDNDTINMIIVDIEVYLNKKDHHFFTTQYKVGFKIQIRG